MRQRISGFGVVGVALFASSTTVLPAFAGTVVDSGNITLASSSYPYRTWDITLDVTGGITQPFEGIPFGMTFHQGKLYVANRGELIYGSGFTYTPSAAGNLTTATTMRTTGMANNDARRFILSGAFTFNTSGAGMGWDQTGSNGLVGLGRGFSGSPPQVYSVAPAAANNWTIGPTSSVPTTALSARDIDYVAALDRFAVLDAGFAPTATISIHTHAASALSDPVTSFTPFANAIAMQPVSAAFAARIVGEPVADQPLLLVAGAPTLIGETDQLELGIYTLTGTLLGTSRRVPTIGVGQVKSIALDEASGQLYVGGVPDFGGFGGRIAVINIPAPAGLVLSAAGLVTASRRRRGQ